MSKLEEAENGTLTARFLFPADFLGFQGHFRGRPVLPAVCEIQGVLAMLEASKKTEVELKEIILAKFSTAVTCDEEVVYACSMAMESHDGAVIKAALTKDGKSVARFKLRVAFRGGSERR
jgi:3-hydroxyacyl-[acyl-carrier-protein] dehydratase